MVSFPSSVRMGGVRFGRERKFRAGSVLWLRSGWDRRSRCGGVARVLGVSAEAQERRLRVG